MGKSASGNGVQGTVPHRGAQWAQPGSERQEPRHRAGAGLRDRHKAQSNPGFCDMYSFKNEGPRRGRSFESINTSLDEKHLNNEVSGVVGPFVK